uniref:Uncharacterized protein n=1 Tax=Rhipicephalus zambeziensis TaxID=60191 RepID=A0A224YGQ0_9ACAR
MRTKICTLQYIIVVATLVFILSTMQQENTLCVSAETPKSFMSNHWNRLKRGLVGSHRGGRPRRARRFLAFPTNFWGDPFPNMAY